MCLVSRACPASAMRFLKLVIALLFPREVSRNTRLKQQRIVVVFTLLLSSSYDALALKWALGLRDDGALIFNVGVGVEVEDDPVPCAAEFMRQRRV